VTNEQIHIVYFIGIGGIGMSALARWFNINGKQVYGYDRTETPLTRKLTDEGIEIHYEDDPNQIPAALSGQLDKTLVIYTPAVPKDHRELNYLKETGVVIKKRAEVLGWITREYYTVAVAGTHGKTTTSSMIAHLLLIGARNPVALLGGIMQEYESNLILNSNRNTRSIAVVEADEYDRSFLHLHPDIAIVTSADADHLDIYGKRLHLIESIKEFISRIDHKGMLILKEDLQHDLSTAPGLKCETYGLDSGNCQAKKIRIEDGSFYFDYHGIGKVIRNIRLDMPGYHNVENAVAAITACLTIGLNQLEILGGLASYKGVKRRFEYLIRTPKLVYIDDYAHHPTEVHALLTSVKSLYPGKKITAIFQPHLFSRTRDFADGFAKSLDQADEVILLDIYPAREQPIEGVGSQMIMDRMEHAHVQLCKDNMLLSCLKNSKPEVLLTIGAGDIDRFVEPIAGMLRKKYHYE